MTNTFSWQAKSQSSTVESCERLCKKIGTRDFGTAPREPTMHGCKANREIKTLGASVRDERQKKILELLAFWEAQAPEMDTHVIGCGHTHDGANADNRAHGPVQL